MLFVAKHLRGTFRTSEQTKFVYLVLSAFFKTIVAGCFALDSFVVELRVCQELLQIGDRDRLAEQTIKANVVTFALRF